MYLTFTQPFPQRSFVILSSNLVLEIPSQSSVKITYYFLVSLNRTHRYLFEFTTPAVQRIITAQRSFLRCSFWALKNTPCIRFSFRDIFIYNRGPSSKTIDFYNPTEVQITVNKQIFTAKRLARSPISTPNQLLSTVYIFTLLYLYHLTPCRGKKFPT